MFSAPCLPDSGSVNVEVNCENATALVSWDWSGGATSYEITATSNDGYVTTCVSEENYCNISELACGQTYNISLTAVSEQCQVTHETDVTFQTSKLTCGFNIHLWFTDISTIKYTPTICLFALQSLVLHCVWMWTFSASLAQL